jgi:DnaJ-class molecular chaperone
VEKDLYEILGVKKDANEKDIKKAFHALAKKYHPDVNPGDKAAEQRFKEVNLAYEVLKDTKKRAQYDQMRAMGADPFGQTGRRGGGPQGPYGAEFYQEFGLGDLFEEIFGGAGPFGGARRQKGGRGGFAQRGADRTYAMTISFTDAARGAEKSIELPEGKRLAVTIPEGVVSGSRIKLSGQGDPGLNGGPNGDLVLELTVTEHPQFTREGKDVSVKVPITFSEAVLGGEVEVPTLDGKVFLKIPKGVSSGQRLKLAGKGIKSGKDVSRGDQYVELLIKIPKGDVQYETAAEKLRELHFNPRA